MISFFLQFKNKIKQQKEIIQKKTFLRVNRNSHTEFFEKKILWRVFQKGSITVEAALITPIFLFAVLNMLSIVDIVRMQSNIQAAMYEVNRQACVYGYLKDDICDAVDIDTGFVMSQLLSQGVVKPIVNDIVGEQYLNNSMVKGGGGGIQYIRSDIMEEGDNIDLLATYQVTPFFKIAAFNDIKLANRCRMHAWTGYSKEYDSDDNNQNEQIVYVTEYGTVYHKSYYCTHLKLSIRSVRKDTINGERNVYDKKYSPCEKCGHKQAGDVLYVTDMGDRYHTNLGCGGLKRTIESIPLSKVSDLPPCSKCGN